MAYASFHEQAKNLEQQAQQSARSVNPRLVPGFETASPPEASLDNPTTLEAARDRVMAINEHAALIKKSAEMRPYFRLDLNTDPLIKNARVPLLNPEVVVAGNDETTSGGEFVMRK